MLKVNMRANYEMAAIQAVAVLTVGFLLLWSNGQVGILVALIIWGMASVVGAIWILIRHGVLLGGEHDGIYCSHCGYDLRGSLVHGAVTCPECGSDAPPHWQLNDKPATDGGATG